VPGYIRYWDGSKWVPGTSKPMPKKAGSGDAQDVVESGAVPPPPRSTGSAFSFPSAQDDAPSAAGAGSEAISEFEPVSQTASSGAMPSFQEAAANGFNDSLDYSAGSGGSTATAAASAPLPKTPAFAPPRPLSEVSFDDAKPSASTFPGRPAPAFPAAAPEPLAPSFTPPKPLSEANFDDILAEAQRRAPQAAPAFPDGPGAQAQAQAQAGPVAGVAGMGISISGAGLPVPPKQTPAQLSAGNQSLRIRLLRPDGKPFDGPEITTGPKQSDAQGASRTEFDTPRGPKKQAPKVVVKAGPLERAGHTLAVLLISAVGIVPLGYLLLQSVHDREDKLAARITVPTKMNVLDSTSEACLGGMVVMLLIVTVLYSMRLRRRRAR